VFRPLGHTELVKIIDKYIVEINELLVRNNKRLIVTDEVKDFILNQEYDYSYGARPLRRLISHFIENPLSDILLEDRFQKRKKITALLKNGKIVFR